MSCTPDRNWVNDVLEDATRHVRTARHAHHFRALLKAVTEPRDRQDKADARLQALDLERHCEVGPCAADCTYAIHVWLAGDACTCGASPCPHHEPVAFARQRAPR